MAVMSQWCPRGVSVVLWSQGGCMVLSVSWEAMCHAGTHMDPGCSVSCCVWNQLPARSGVIIGDRKGIPVTVWACDPPQLL